MTGPKIAALLLVSAAVGGLAALIGPGKPDRLTFLAVGQGDCAIFQSGGRTVLIDVGPNIRGNDAGKRIVVPALRNLGIDAVDLIVISHPDADHSGGLASVLKGVRVGRVAIPEGFRGDPAMRRQLAEAGCPESKVHWLKPAQSATVGDFSLQIACPDWEPGDPDNEGSNFVKISNGRASAVFTGDASAEVEARLLGRGDWSGQILKLGHHGSKSSTSDSWLKEVQPQWAIVSCGKVNSYGHPHPDVLRRVERHGIKLARTDREGAIVFELGPSGWQRKP